ncbi:hypothetical protein Tco_0538023 [Tanacetum coccineum]
MVLQLTDFTSEITDEELREFTSEYYIPLDCTRYKPSYGVEGVRPLRDGEEPLLESTAGRIMGIVAGEQRRNKLLVSLEDADVAGAESDAGEVGSGLKRKRAASDDGVGTSKRVHHVRLVRSVEDHLRVSAVAVTHAAQSPSQTSPLTADDISRRDREIGPKAFEGMPVDQLMEEFDMVTAQQAALVAQLRARTQLEYAQLSRSLRGLMHRKMEVKMALLVKRVEWDVGEAGGRRSYANSVLSRMRALYPHMLSAIAEAGVKQSFGDVCEELVAAMEAMKLLELPHIAQLERDQDYPIGVIMAGLTLARHATEGAEAQPDYFLKPDVAQLQVPIFASHIPRSDGVPVSVATVLPKDSELLGKLEEAGDARSTKLAVLKSKVLELLLVKRAPLQCALCAPRGMRHKLTQRLRERCLTRIQIQC